MKPLELKEDKIYKFNMILASHKHNDPMIVIHPPFYGRFIKKGNFLDGFEYLFHVFELNRKFPFYNETLSNIRKASKKEMKKIAIDQL